jgi:hypothetical protein
MFGSHIVGALRISAGVVDVNVGNSVQQIALVAEVLHSLVDFQSD